MTTEHKLVELQKSFKTDKGTAHNYLQHYDILFEKYINKNINFLEIGILFGESLKLFSSYFTHGNIYGIENFEQKDGHAYHNFKPVIKEEVVESLKSYKRIKLFDFNCEDIELIKINLNNLKFDIIIDDASHAPQQQMNNLKNYSKYLNDDGIYICEDILGVENGNFLKDYAKTIYPNKIIELIEFNVHLRCDDIILVVR